MSKTAQVKKRRKMESLQKMLYVYMLSYMETRGYKSFHRAHIQNEK